MEEERGIPARSLKAWNLARSIITGDWLIPAYNDKGNIASLRKDNGKRWYVTTGQGSHLFGDVNANKHQESDVKCVLVCEGPWDGMAADAMLRSYGRRKRDKTAIIALPSAGSHHKKLHPAPTTVLERAY